MTLREALDAWRKEEKRCRKDRASWHWVRADAIDSVVTSIERYVRDTPALDLTIQHDDHPSVVVRA